jgi:hypothetical protein
VVNYRFGVNNSVPQQALDVTGNILTSNGHVYTGANISFDIGEDTNWWRTVYSDSIQATNLTGTLLTNAQPNITSLGTINNLSVSGNLSLDGNLIVNGISVGNLSANTITANVFGNITGYVLQGDQPFITNLANITVDTITILSGNLVIGGNVNFDVVYAGNFYQGGNRALDTSSNLQINGDVVGYGFYNSINLALTTTGVAAGVYGDDGIFPQISVDSKGRIISAANISLSKVANLNFSNTTISSNTDLTISTVSGNIYLDAGSTGIVQIVGQDAIGLPAGDNISRPPNPYIGYLRYNTDINDIEYWNGNIWFTPAGGVISSDTITPDGVSNVFVLSTNSSTLGVMVSINGTLQQPTTSYTIINNNQIQFTEIPLTTDIVEVRHIVAGSQTVATGLLSFGPTTLVKLDAENVNVTGNILPSADSTYSLGNSSLSWNTLYANDIVGTSPNIIVASSGVTTNVDVYSTSVYRTAKYILQANANSTFESLECLVTHDGSTAYRTVYGIISSGASLGNVTAIVTGGNVLVQYTSINNNTNIRISTQYLLI